jgi:hypothetical protein
MPGVPVCFLYDGEAPPACVSGLPDVTFLTRSNVKNPELREKSFGPGVTKMVALFEAPFETFLYLDADTTACGDLKSLADFSQHDFVVDIPPSNDEAAVNQWFFDTRLLEQSFPDFPWRDYANSYFCTGTFFARRNCFSLEEYLELLALSRQQPKLFKFWEMGILNFMIFRGKHEGRLRVESRQYQFVTRDHSWSSLEERFNASRKKGGSSQKAAVYHYPMTKPHLLQKGAYTFPMSFFRRRFQELYLKRGPLRSWIALIIEDMESFHIPFLKRKTHHYLSRIYRKSGLRKMVNHARA